MQIVSHPKLTIRRSEIGAEQAPMLIVDNVVADPQALAGRAAPKVFTTTSRYFPGVRAKAPLSYQHFLLALLREPLRDVFSVSADAARLSMCSYSLVTTAPGDLAMIQRIPHIDATGGDIATVHYLFRGSYDGTAFYRHRSTGYEIVDLARSTRYFSALEAELAGADAPAAGYINGSTALFEQVGKLDGVFNRMLVYRRNSLHSGCIAADFVPDANPASGRLSINSFIDVSAGPATA